MGYYWLAGAQSMWHWRDRGSSRSTWTSFLYTGQGKGLASTIRMDMQRYGTCVRSTQIQEEVRFLLWSSIWLQIRLESYSWRIGSSRPFIGINVRFTPVWVVSGKRKLCCTLVLSGVAYAIIEALFCNLSVYCWACDGIETTGKIGGSYKVFSKIKGVCTMWPWSLTDSSGSSNSL